MFDLLLVRRDDHFEYAVSIRLPSTQRLAVGYAPPLSNRATPNWISFEPNAGIVRALSLFLSGAYGAQPNVADRLLVADGRRYLVDERSRQLGGSVPHYDVVGRYETDEFGRVLLASFSYNPTHALVTTMGVSSSWLRHAPFLRFLEERQHELMPS